MKKRHYSGVCLG